MATHEDDPAIQIEKKEKKDEAALFFNPEQDTEDEDLPLLEDPYDAEHHML